MTEITEERIEAAAEAAWRAEVSEIGAARRARESSLWADQQEAAKDKWRHLVRAALAAFASRPTQGGEWVDRCPECGCKTKADIEKPDGSPDGRVRCVECKRVFARAMLSASPSPYGVGGWRDIATSIDQTSAPWDGVPVLIVTNHNWGGDINRVHRARWSDAIHGAGIFGWVVDDCKFGPYALRGYTLVTHWRPLPAPPSLTKDQSNG